MCRLRWTKLAGVSFGDCQENIRKWGCDDIGSYTLIREPDNKYDSNAISVSLFNKFKLGYIPASINREYAEAMDAGLDFDVEFIRTNHSADNSTIGIIIAIKLRGKYEL